MADNRKRFFLFNLVRPFFGVYCLIIILSIVHGFLSSVNIVAIFPILNVVLGETPFQTETAFQKLVQLVHIIPIQDPILAGSLFLLIVTLVNLGSGLLLEYLIGYSSSNVGYLITDKLFRKYSMMEYDFFVEQKHGKLFYDLFTAPQRTVILITRLSELVAVVCNIIFLIVLLFMLNIKFTVGVLCFICAFALAMGAISKHVSYGIGRRRKQFFTQMQVTANEFINGVKQILVYRAQNKWIRDFDVANKDLKQNSIQEVLWGAYPKYLLELVFFLFIIMLALLARQKAISTEYLKNMALYLIALVRLLPYVTSFGRLRMTVTGYLPDAEGAYAVFDEQLPVVKEEGKVFAGLRHAIEFKEAAFRYKDRTPLFESLSVRFEAMKTTAIVGVSGSGKTTIVNLLLHLLRPQSGQILIDGEDLSAYSVASWLGNIGFVSQDLFTFNATIRENICFGGEHFSTADIIAAAKVAHAHEFIQELPQQYETICGEKGMKLSIGQQQRISIARAIIRNPSILIFDEATSSLDTVSEMLIQQALGEISKNRTVIVIAHRLSTIKSADKIIVLKEGKKVEEGTHSELIARKGAYWELYSKTL